MTPVSDARGRIALSRADPGTARRLLDDALLAEPSSALRTFGHALFRSHGILTADWLRDTFDLRGSRAMRRFLQDQR